MTSPFEPAQTVPAGAYGLALTGECAPEPGDALFLAAEPGWPTVEVRCGPEREFEAPAITDEHARIPLLTGGWFEAWAAERRAIFYRDPRPDRHYLAHPGAAPIGSIFGRWLGREPFHGGAVMVDGAAWVVLGEKEAGKSTLMARFALDGVAVLADDLAIVADGQVLAGPRCVDLREESAERLGVERELVPVRDGERWRLTLDPVPPAVRLAGWVLLERGVETGIAKLPVAERMQRLADHRAVRLPPNEPRDLLDFASLPTYVFTRPHRWEQLEGTTERLVEVLRNSTHSPSC